MSLTDHITDLTSLTDGWAGPRSKAPTVAAVAAATAVAREVDTAVADRLTVAACIDGGLLLEGTVGASVHLTAQVEYDGTHMFLLRDDAISDDLHEHEGPLDVPAAAAFLTDATLPASPLLWAA